jgi:hypothetical protein
VPLAENAVEVAMPFASVVSVSAVVPLAKVPLAPDAGAVNVTATPLAGFEPLSNTVALSGDANEVLTALLCGVPPVAVIEAAGPAMLVRLKLAGVVTPATVAVTVSAPAVPFAVKGADVATPLAFVVAVLVFDAVSANVPLAPVAGALNTTTAPLTGFWPLSTTVTTIGAANEVFTMTPCDAPLVAAIVAGAPVVFVRLKLAGVAAPEVAAVTV